MKDQNALSYVNLHAVLGALPMLCSMDERAAELIADENVSIGFAVRNGASATLFFKDGKCTMKDGLHSPTILIPFATPEKFNGMIDGTVTPIPVKGLLHVGFLLKKFTALTDILEEYLRGEPEDEERLRRSTILLLGVIGRAVCALGNNDEVAKASASYIVDGCIRINIRGGASVSIAVKDHRLRTVPAEASVPTAMMEFRDIPTARALFDGKLNAVAAIGEGKVSVRGFVSQVDNLNRILDRVSYYLA